CWHDLRHFYASWLINRCVDGGLELPIKVVSNRLGHTGIQMTSDTYAHLFPSQDKRRRDERRRARCARLTCGRRSVSGGHQSNGATIMNDTKTTPEEALQLQIAITRA